MIIPVLRKLHVTKDVEAACWLLANQLFASIDYLKSEVNGNRNLQENLNGI
jgi:hypothetical protein